MSKNLFALNLTALLLPENERYSTGSILYLETRFSNGIVKNKYLVLIDDEEPPLFFFINTKPDRRKWNECIIELSPERYTFLDHASYLDYFTEASALDYVDYDFPTKDDILSALKKDPARIKGKLKREEAQLLLNGIDEHRNNLEFPFKQRIRKALTEYLRES